MAIASVKLLPSLPGKPSWKSARSGLVPSISTR
jgi:hypothetical protein